MSTWMWVVFIGLTVFFTLTACTTPEQKAAKDAAACQGYGFTPGSEPYANCLMTLDQNRKNNARAAARALILDDSTKTTICRPVGNAVYCN